MTFKQVIVVRTDLKMGKGKIASQSAHASIGAFLKAEEKHFKWVDEWINEGQAKVVLKVNSLKELMEVYKQVKDKFPTVLICDAGRTQIESGTPTAIGIGPAKENELDKFTGKLKLL